MNYAALAKVILSVSVVMIIIEVVWSWKKNKGVYNGKETLANFAILIGGQLFKPVSLAWQVLVLGSLAELALFEVEATPAIIALTVLATDFVYYVAHRAKHEVKALWTFHMVHHSSPWMNLTTSFRINWFSPLVGVFFYAPLVLLGLPPEIIGTALTINLGYQFLMHTEAVGTLGFLEGIINTPSAHRVHHGSNPLYLDKNHGGMLMVWDRLFGTYQPEVEQVRYGITSGFVSHNPLTLIFHGFVDYARGRL